ncbi:MULTISPECIES: hypothetical protein [unclassified Phaeobacter]|uniref:hypothetical protein n=1 Tax=unclassified Phaeobacter TaxID=2621772 RepID=UPI003A8C7AAC
MAQLDTRLPLMAQQPDIVNALARSSAAAQQTNQVQGQNALRNLFQTQGADIAAGQPQALNALAQLDPMQAVQMQSARQDMQSRAQLMAQRRIAMGREAEAYAASLGAQERAQEAARVEQGIAQGMQFYQRGDLNGLNQLLGTVGEEPLQSLDEFPTVAAMYGDVLDRLKAVQELTAPPKPMSGPGKVQADISAGLLPEGTPLSSSPQTTVNVETGAGGKFYEAVDKQQGQMVANLIEQGTQVPQKLAQIDELERVLGAAATPQGIEAALKYSAGQLGIQTEGLDALQAAQAMINQLVPQQRMPGSGPMSDADLALFIRSLPQLINTREGNQAIIQAMRGLAVYQQRQAAIAGAVADRTITPKEGRKALSEIENPLLAFRKGEKGAPATISGAVDADTQSLIDKYAGDQ